MGENNTILEAIKADVKAQSDLVVNQINEEVKNLRDDQIGYYTEGLKKETDTYLEKELNDLKLFAATKASQEKLKTKHDLLAIRSELVNGLFEEVHEKVVSFVQSKDYKTYLEKKVKLIPSVSSTANFLVREEDVALMKEVLKDCNISSNVKTMYFELGGFLYEDEASGVEYDFSLDSNLKESKTWFQNNSGFTL